MSPPHDLEMNKALMDPNESESSLERVGTLKSYYDEAAKHGKIISACTFYSFCSVSMVLVNKSLASRYVAIFA